MRYESAELAKISINICLISSVTTANVISELCEKIGADWGEIAPALRLDKRIGQFAYINPGLGIAGGNLERDLVTLREGLTAEGGSLGVVRAWEEDLNYRADWAFRKLMGAVSTTDSPCIGVLGLAYKQDTNSIKNSPSIRLIRKLSGLDVQAYDPAAEVDCSELNILRKNSALAACKGCNVVVIMTPWSEFRELDPAALAGVMRGGVIIDPFRVLSAAAVKSAGLSYITLGMRAEGGIF
jgi:UDPglucose 6-dehydrogenase